MPEVSLIVEGEEDFRFLQDFIAFHFKKNVDRGLFIEINGKSEKIRKSKAKIQTSTASGKMNVVIFDADDKDHKSTLKNINSEAEKQSLLFDYIFLLPDDESPGNLESLLRSSVAKGNEKLFNCIEGYASCKEALKLKDSRPISEKVKILIYHGSFQNSGDAKGTKRDYKNEIWDLNSPSLEPLKKFLSKFF